MSREILIEHPGVGLALLAQLPIHCTPNKDCSYTIYVILFTILYYLFLYQSVSINSTICYFRAFFLYSNLTSSFFIYIVSNFFVPQIYNWLHVTQ